MEKRRISKELLKGIDEASAKEILTSELVVNAIEFQTSKLKKDLETQEYSYSRLNEEYKLMEQSNKILKDTCIELKDSYASQVELNKRLLSSNSKLNNEIFNTNTDLMSVKEMLKIESFERDSRTEELNSLLVRFQDLDKKHTFWKAIGLGCAAALGLSITLLSILLTR